jgi:hypothetical protein
MFRRWKDTRAKDGANTSRRASDRTVRTAERLVRRAWVLELARWRDRQEFALRIERGNCDNAIEQLIAARRDGDTAQISVACDAALEALDAVHAAVVARDQARRAMRKELRVPMRRSKGPRAAADVGGHPRSDPTVPVMSAHKPRGRHPRRLVRWRSADLGRP